MRDAGFGLVYEWYASAAANGRFVAVGDEGNNLESRIWTSGNGRSWALSELPSQTSTDAALRDVTPGGPGFVVVGSNGFGGEGLALLSADGRSWEHIVDDSFVGWNLSHVRSTGDRLVAFGFDDFGEPGPMWVSGDGRDWDIVESETASAIARGLLALEAWDGRVVAFSTGEPEPPSCRRPVLVWETIDGLSWTQAGEIAGAGCAGRLDVAAGPNGWVAMGSLLPAGERTSVDRAWRSADGRAWQEAQNSPSTITDVFADDAGYVAVGHYYPEAGCALDPASAIGQTWTSTDGSTWIKQPESGWEHLEIDLIRRYGRELIGIGIDWTSDEGVGAIWTADLPANAGPAAPAPNPTPTPEPNEGCG